MTKSNALTPVDQKNVDFYGDKVIAVRLANGRIFVPVRPLVEALGLSWSSQLQRIRRDPVLKTELFSVFVTNTESQRGGRDVQCLPLDYVSGFLFGIRADRVRDDLRERVIRYQRECYKVLAEAFQEGRLSTEQNFQELLEQDTDAVQAYKIATAIVKLAKQQILLEGRVGDSEVRLDNVEERLTNLEEQLSGSDVITEAQASQLSQAVKAVAIALGKQTGRNEFGACYGEIYRKFNIASYRQLPRSKFEEAMSFLAEWHQSLVGDNPF